MPVHGFRFYFTPLAGVLFTFPSRYSFAIGSCLVFSLGSWSTRIPAGFLVPRRTQALHQEVPSISHTRLSRSLTLLPRSFCYVRVLSQLPGPSPCSPATPLCAVWAPPRSLAATGGISLDFLSCWYLDGSLPSVFLRRAIYSRAGAGHSLPAGYPIREPRDRRMLAPTPGLSRLAAPFFASQLPGIHSWTLVSLDHIVISVPSL